MGEFLDFTTLCSYLAFMDGRGRAGTSHPVPRQTTDPQARRLEWTTSIYSVKKFDRKALVSSISLTALFTAFLGTLPSLLEDERDLCGYSGQDPAVDLWIRAADASLAATKAACAAMLAAPDSGRDRPQRAACRTSVHGT
jgi:hypothetical protein